MALLERHFCTHFNYRDMQHMKQWPIELLDRLTPSGASLALLERHFCIYFNYRDVQFMKK